MMAEASPSNYIVWDFLLQCICNVYGDDSFEDLKEERQSVALWLLVWKLIFYSEHFMEADPVIPLKNWDRRQSIQFPCSSLKLCHFGKIIKF